MAYFRRRFYRRRFGGFRRRFGFRRRRFGARPFRARRKPRLYYRKKTAGSRPTKLMRKLIVQVLRKEANKNPDEYQMTHVKLWNKVNGTAKWFTNKHAVELLNQVKTPWSQYRQLYEEPDGEEKFPKKYWYGTGPEVFFAEPTAPLGRGAFGPETPAGWQPPEGM